MRIFLCTLMLLLGFNYGKCQETHNETGDIRKQLEAQRKEILQEIDDRQQELNSLQKEKKVSLNQYRALQEMLKSRQQLIDNINDEIVYINRTIYNFNKKITALKNQLEGYKLMYSKSIRFAYKSRNSYSMLVYICSSTDYNDALRRMKYLKIMRAMRKQQGDKIRATHAAIYHELDLLNAEKKSKDKLLNEMLAQKEKLASESNETEATVKDLFTREKELSAEIANKKKSAKRLNDAIQAVIAREMKNSEEKAIENKEIPEKEEKTKLKEEGIPVITKSEIEIGRNFEKKKGKLACPVENGKVIGHFGKYKIKNLELFNNGVEYQANADGKVFAVAEGRVSSVLPLDGKQIVIMQHGHYFTVYSNLLNATVSKGQKIAEKQEIGIVAKNEDGLPSVNFQVWKSNGSKHETTVLNPEPWVNKKMK